MLARLAIRNLALVESAELEFSAGLNVLTGETGAGKSVLLHALGLALGDRARSEVIREGCDRAEIEAVFEVQTEGALYRRLEAAALVDADEPELIVRRVICRGRSGRILVNGRSVSLGELRRLLDGVVDLGTQHQQLSLRRPELPLNLLDEVFDSGASRRGVQAAWDALQTARDQLQAIRDGARQGLERQDYVRFLLDELRAAELVEGEADDLEVRHRRLVHGRTLCEGLERCERAMGHEDRGALVLLVGALRELTKLTGLDPTLHELAERLEASRLELEDLSFDLAHRLTDIQGEPGALEAVEERMGLLRSLRRKHGVDHAGLLEKQRDLEGELESLVDVDEHVAAAEERERDREDTLTELARVLSRGRADAAQRLSAAVDAHLAELGMGGARVRFGLTVNEQAGRDGYDDAVLLAQLNEGEGFHPVGRVASGGELARLLIAIKAALRPWDPVDVSVFDEVDSAVGGAMAEVVGQKLKLMGGERQVIAITHQAQIAMHAHRHLVVSKSSDDGRTTTTARALGGHERKEELARMVGGLEITARTRRHAEELLARGTAA